MKTIPISKNIHVSPEMLNEVSINNLNQVIVGNAGCGKTRHCIIPQICACVGNYIICDPYFEVQYHTATILEKAGYHIIAINSNDFGYFFNDKANKAQLERDILKAVQPQISFSEKCAVFISAPPSDCRSGDFYWLVIRTILYNLQKPLSEMVNIIMENVCLYEGTNEMMSIYKSAGNQNIRFVVTAQGIKGLIGFFGADSLSDVLSVTYLKLYMGITDTKKLRFKKQNLIVKVGDTVYCDIPHKYTGKPSDN